MHTPDGLTWIGGGFSLFGCYITSLSDLHKLTHLGGGISICYEYLLPNLNGLAGLLTIGGDLSISDNLGLTSLTGLDNVTSISGDLGIYDNSSLTSLTGLENIDAGSITSLYICNNSSLSECDVKSICDYLVAPNGTIEIQDNATGCNSKEEVKANCKLGYEDYDTPENPITIYPNPSSTSFTISTTTSSNKNTFLTIYNLNGQQLISHQITEPTTVIDVGTLPSGVYVVRMVWEKGVQVEKFVKK